MVHLSTTVMNLCSELGHMLSDASYCPEGVTQDDIMNFLTSVVLEFESSFNLSKSNLDDMKSDIKDYFEYCTSEKNKLVAEESAEAAAEITAGAAMIVSSALVWLPGASFALSAYEVAAEATALALQVESEKLEKTVIEDISTADEKLRDYSSFSYAKTYLDAQSSNTKFFPRLKQGMTILDMRAFFMATVMTVKKELGRVVTNEDLETKFITWYQTTEADDTLVSDYTKMLDEIEENPDEFTNFNKEFEDRLSHIVSPDGRKVSGTVMLVLAIGMCVKKGIIYYKFMQNTQRIVATVVEMAPLNSDGSVDADEEISGQTEVEMFAQEEQVIGLAGMCSMAIGVLAGIASIVFGGLEAAHASDTDDTLSKAIKDAKSALTDYYTSLVNGS